VHYYCYDCIKKLKELFDNRETIIMENAHHSYHCISCGQHEDRKIIDADGLLICNKCVTDELTAYGNK